MSENVKRFLEAVSQDKEFLEKINEASSPETVIALAAEKGFTLTVEDLKPAATGELSDDELDGVAGGFGGGVPLDGIVKLQQKFF